MNLDPIVLAAILAMAGATYLTRIAGYILVQKVGFSTRLASALEAVPGAILIALIAPIVLATGVAETLAALVTLLLARKVPSLLAIVGGVAAVALLRQFH
ncbi:MAG: AzlD domain-containing protein [Kiloniellales bacterium]|nr:AzlD domain-containing protein [Kiloniellales bacterium]